MGSQGRWISHQAPHGLPAVFAVEKAAASQNATATLSVCRRDPLKTTTAFLLTGSRGTLGGK